MQRARHLLPLPSLAWVSHAGFCLLGGIIGQDPGDPVLGLLPALSHQQKLPPVPGNTETRLGERPDGAPGPFLGSVDVGASEFTSSENLPSTQQDLVQANRNECRFPTLKPPMDPIMQTSYPP